MIKQINIKFNIVILILHLKLFLKFFFFTSSLNTDLLSIISLIFCLKLNIIFLDEELKFDIKFYF